MNVFAKPSRVLAFTLALTALTAHPQSTDPAVPPTKPRPHKPRTPTAHSPAFDPNLILLDPAHGGNDPGGQLSPNLPEKQLTLDLARRIRPLLAAKGFTVVLTREADPVPQAPAPPDPDNPDAKPTPPPPPPQIIPDQRAELANRLRPAACLILHATSSGHGVHLYTSSLTPPLASGTPPEILRWDTAQAPAIANSQRLAQSLSEALTPLGIPIVSGTASIRPIDSMTCPAVAIEIAPTTTPIADDPYQQHLAESITSALVAWRTQAQAILDDQSAFAAREAERDAMLAKTNKKPAEKSPEKNPDKPIARSRPAPGSLIPNAPAPLPKIPQIPQIPKIVAPAKPAQNNGSPR